MKEIFHGEYGTRIYLPLSGLSGSFRRFSKQLKAKEDLLPQRPTFSGISWNRCTAKRNASIWEHGKARGNIRISEFGVINLMASECGPGEFLFEIGTFDGRTSLNLAFSSPADCEVYTLDTTPVKEGGRIVWHDYGIWDGVTKALAEVEAKEQLGLKSIRGTSLVYWKNAQTTRSDTVLMISIRSVPLTFQ